MSRRKIHERVLNAVSVDELADVYAQWADSYDNDLQGEMGYEAPVMVSRLLRANLPPDATRVLDAGCGTGLVGVALTEFGYSNIDGLDYSKEMLAQAELKGVYTFLAECDLMQPLDLAQDEYDAVTCLGTFTLGHVGPFAFRELNRVTRTGGYICFTVRDEAWKTDKYLDAILLLVQEGLWVQISIDVVEYIQEEQSMCHLCLFRVC
ncbi:MAG: putative TPR repeat methyltransferase [Candidatus Azotimanducaceae bacterium]|jgi:predicted TPR repeat methyltransferase